MDKTNYTVMIPSVGNVTATVERDCLKGVESYFVNVGSEYIGYIGKRKDMFAIIFDGDTVGYANTLMQAVEKILGHAHGFGMLSSQLN